MVWIYGGGWETGTSKWYDGRSIVAQSMAIVSPNILCSRFVPSREYLFFVQDRPVIYVSLNYVSPLVKYIERDC